MPKLQDHAIILHVQPFSESDMIVHAFTREHGIVHGLMKGARSKRSRNKVDIGMLGVADWSARLPEHLGSLRFEAEVNYASFWLSDPFRLHMLTSSVALIRHSFGERDPHPQLFDRYVGLLAQMRGNEDRATQALAYLKFECALLEEAGFGLSLNECAATGSRDDLIYVSPKTGRAVSRDAGAPYAEKLLPLPSCLKSIDSDSLVEAAEDSLLDGLRTTGHFLAYTLQETAGKSMPSARDQLLRLVRAA